MDLYIFSRDLTFLGIIDTFSSLRWTRRYRKSGEFELHCNLNSSSLNLLQKENIIFTKDETEAGYIEYRELTQDNTGKELLIIKGNFLTAYLNRRIVWGTETLNITAELAMRQLITDNAIAPSDSNRVINNLVLGTLNNYVGTVNYQAINTNLADEEENLSNVSNLGHRIDFDVINKQLVFQVYKGLNKSVNQEVNPKTIFSTDFENVLTQDYIDSLNNYKNLCYVGGFDGRLQTIGTSSGLDRLECFSDQKSLSNEIDSVAMSDTDYNNLLIGKGNETLATFLEVETFVSTINNNSNLVYKVDFDLGDIVTCLSKKWGITLDTRITEIEIDYEEKGKTIIPTFGNVVPTILDKIKNLI